MTDVDPDPAETGDAAAEPPAKKARAEKTPTKKTPAKKTPAKKTPATKSPAKKPAKKKATPAEKPPAETTPAEKQAPVERKATRSKRQAPEHETVAVEEPTVTFDDPTPADATLEGAVPPEETPVDETGELEHADEPRPSRIEQVKALAAEVEARGRATYQHLEEQRAESRAIDSVFVAAEHDEKIGGGILAGAIAFRLFLFLVPLVFVVVVGFGLGADAAGQSTHDAAQSAGAAGLLARSMANIADGSVGTRLTAFVVGSFALWLTSRSCLKVLRIASGLTWGVPSPKLPRLTRAAGIFILIVLGSVVLVQLLSAVRDATFLIGLLATLLFVLVPAGLWMIVSYRGLPHAVEAGWRAMVPGSLLFGIGIQLLHLFTVFWIARQVESKSDTYGAIGVALALLFWAYLVGRLITAGMTLNAALWYRDHPRDDADTTQPIQSIKEQ